MILKIYVGVGFPFLNGFGRSVRANLFPNARLPICLTRGRPPSKLLLNLWPYGAQISGLEMGEPSRPTDRVYSARVLSGVLKYARWAGRNPAVVAPTPPGWGMGGGGGHLQLVVSRSAIHFPGRQLYLFPNYNFVYLSDFRGMFPKRSPPTHLRL